MAIAPLNIPGYAQPQSIDWTPLNQLGKEIQVQRKQAALGDIMSGADFNNPQSLQALATQAYALDPQTGLTLANLGIQQANTQYQRGRDEKSDAWRQQESERAQRNADRSYGLQARAAARADEDKWTISKVDNPDGTSSLVRVNPRTGQSMLLSPTGGAPVAGSPPVGNPFSAGGKFNEGQGKAAGFTDRMLLSEGILSGVDGGNGVQGQGASAIQTGVGAIPGVGNYLISGDRQKYEQARRDFINAQLRRESGAAVSPSEFDSAQKQYFPSPGDSAEVIAQKTANRRAAISAMGRESGPSYRPKYAFDEKGRVVTYGYQPKQSQPSANTQTSRPANVGISQQQYNSLPSGSVFTAPDGTQRIKP